MHNYRLMRKGALVEIFIDDQISPSRTVNANLRNELRAFFASCKVPQADIDHKVHELYTTNTTSFTAD